MRNGRFVHLNMPWNVNDYCQQVKSFWFFAAHFLLLFLTTHSYECMYVCSLFMSAGINVLCIYFSSFIICDAHTFVDTCNMQTTQIRASWFMSTIIRWGALSFRWIVCVRVVWTVRHQLAKNTTASNTMDEDMFPLCKRRKPKRVLLHFRQTTNQANNSHAIPIDGMSFWMRVLYLVCHVTNQVRFKKQKKKKQSNK